MHQATYVQNTVKRFIVSVIFFTLTVNFRCIFAIDELKRKRRKRKKNEIISKLPKETQRLLPVLGYINNEIQIIKLTGTRRVEN